MRPRFAVTLLMFAACTTSAACGPQDAGARTKAVARKVRPLSKVETPADLGERALAHVVNVVAFGDRYAGQPGWRKQLDYIAAAIEKCGLRAEHDGWTEPKENLFFENLSVTIPGSRQERIVLAAHHDTKRTQGHDDPAHNFAFAGANDGGSGIGLLLAMLPALQAHKGAATIQLLFLDGEESLDWDWNHAARALFGSKRFVKAHRDALLVGSEKPIVAMVLLDMVGRADLHLQEETYSTAELREILWSAAVACGHQQHFFAASNGAEDDHKPFLDAGIPAVDLIDLEGNPTWHKPTDTVANLSAASLQQVGEVVLTMLPEIERQYLPNRAPIR
ncbi:MAG TPA: M28 family metallopeptidase [Planctomycetota bacterium]|nr:M28 family metallopeptidase [Planctomycetota bacterium]